jgi:hypothetical protein
VLCQRHASSSQFGSPQLTFTYMQYGYTCTFTEGKTCCLNASSRMYIYMSGTHSMLCCGMNAPPPHTWDRGRRTTRPPPLAGGRGGRHPPVCLCMYMCVWRCWIVCVNSSLHGRLYTYKHPRYPHMCHPPTHPLTHTYIHTHKAQPTTQPTDLQGRNLLPPAVDKIHPIHTYIYIHTHAYTHIHIHIIIKK